MRFKGFTKLNLSGLILMNWLARLMPKNCAKAFNTQMQDIVAMILWKAI